MLLKEDLYQIIRRCQKGDRHAQFRLYEAFHGWSLAICRRYNASEETAQECVQDGFFKVFTKIHHYNNSEPFQPWLKTVMIRTCIDHHRANFKEPEKVELDAVPDETDLAEVMVNMDIEHLLFMLRQLPPAYQMTLNLYAIEGYSYQEVANMLGVNVGSVKSNLSKARSRLKSLLLASNELESYAR